MRTQNNTSKKTLSVKQKLLLYILVPIAIIFIGVFIFVLTDFQSKVKKNTEKLVQYQTKTISAQIQNELNHFIELNRFLKQNFESFENIPMENRRRELSSLMHDVISKNPGVISVWSNWELNSIDTLDREYVNKTGGAISGNFSYMLHRENGQIKISEYVINASIIKLYNETRIKKKEVVESHIDPQNNQILQTNIAMPLYKDNQFLGVVGIDMELEIIKITGNIENGEIYLFSNNGRCIFSSLNKKSGDQIDKIFRNEDKTFNLSEKIKKGNSSNFYFKGANELYYYAIHPVTIGETGTPWSFVIKLPDSYIKDQTRKSVHIIVWGGVLLILLVLLSIFYLSNNISQPIIKLREKMDLLAKGETSKHFSEKTVYSEIRDISRSYNLVSEALQNPTRFAEEMKEGNLDAEYKLSGETDKLGKALIAIRDQIKESVREQEKRQEDEKKRYWLSDGLAKLNEILRKQDNLENYTYNIISYLVNYLDANQGGIFIRNQEDENNKFLELKAFYAFDRRKFIQKTFEPGEGLVGNCALEKNTIHLTEIPENYIKVTSGLGGSNPKSLLLVPMKIEEEVLGIIEIASFNNFEQYHIDFLEQASLSIASSLNMAETNRRTSELLEKTQQQAETMAEQEQTMRQNMEELKATQEESARRAEEFEKKSDEIQKINIIMEKQLEKALRKLDKLTEQNNKKSQ